MNKSRSGRRPEESEISESTRCPVVRSLILMCHVQQRTVPNLISRFSDRFEAILKRISLVKHQN